MHVRRSRLLSRVGGVALTAALAVAITMLAPSASAVDEDELRAVRDTRAAAARIAIAARRARAARRAEAARVNALLRHIATKRVETERWQRVITGRPRSSNVRTLAFARSPASLERALRLWTERAARARRQAHRPPRLQAWLCIHRHEGAWDDPNAPYYGGLQMNLGFQQAYGADLLRRRGTADNWTPLEQIWAAERAYRSGRGFYPWPNTARACGLII
jgi:hypothetical protein